SAGRHEGRSRRESIRGGSGRHSRLCGGRQEAGTHRYGPKDGELQLGRGWVDAVYYRRQLSLPDPDEDKGERMVRAFLGLLVAAASVSGERVYIGTSGKGIYLADFDEKSGKLSAPEIVSDTAAPSYLTIHEGHLYAVNEVKDGAVSSFTIDRSSGKLTPLNSVSVKSA